MIGSDIAKSLSWNARGVTALHNATAFGALDHHVHAHLFGDV
jgi:hypothetical protein